MVIQVPTFDVKRAGSLFPVAGRHLSSRLRDTLYAHSTGRIDVTRPRRFYGILNERCNLKCQGCHYWRMPHYAQELAAEEWVRILADIKDFVGPYHINFSGGEPLLKKGLDKILFYCRDNDILAGLTTSAIILRSRQIEQLVEAKLFSLNISVDGAQASTHDPQRGVQGSFNKVLQAIAQMQGVSARRGVPIPIIIKPTISRLNYHG